MRVLEPFKAKRLLYMLFKGTSHDFHNFLFSTEFRCLRNIKKCVEETKNQKAAKTSEDRCHSLWMKNFGTNAKYTNPSSLNLHSLT